MPRKKASPSKQSTFELSSAFHSINFKQREFNFSVKQQKLLESILEENTKIIFVAGPAGSSKTYMSVYGCLQLMAKDFQKDLLYIRSIAESGLTSYAGHTRGIRSTMIYNNSRWTSCAVKTINSSARHPFIFSPLSNLFTPV